MLVKELMSKVVSCLGGDATLKQVVRLMRSHNHSCVLVVDEREPVGIITERDLVGVLEQQLSGAATELLACDVMTPKPVCVPASTPLLEALLLARSRRLRHLPVVDENGELAGLVTHTDMVDTYVELLERQSELELANQQLQALSLEDALLAIGNRRALEMELALAEAHAHRHRQSYALAMFDVDWFKRYNDRYGHPQGDVALRAVADAIKECMRGSDRLYRYGGEELILLMPASDKKAAKTAAERACKAVQARALPHLDSPLEVLTVSAGVAAGIDVNGAELIDLADQALYRAKQAGRNRVAT